MAQPLAPVAGQNINMVSGTQWPDGDPYLQRQNEPSVAVSTRNPLSLLAGANDYRTVDVPFPPDQGQETGDAWLGVFRSTDGGQTWRSTLLPGFPQDRSATGTASPLKAFAVATDPTVRAGTHGLFYFSGLAFNRGNNAPTSVFVASYQDQNNKENGNPVTYLGATLVDNGTTGQFLDKPWIAVDIPRPGTSVGAATCTISGKTFTSGNVYLVYSTFLGNQPPNNPHTQISFVRSTNCGATWSQPSKVSESFQLNQGTVAAIDPANGTLHIAWRQFATSNQPDAIVWAKSTDGGQSFTKGSAIYTFAPGATFDQGVTTAQFRALSLPTLAVDAGGRVFAAFSLRGAGPSGDARIVISTLAPGSSSWTAPYVADSTATNRGHQFLPALSYAYGKLMLIFYDFREDVSKSFTAFVSDAGLHIRHTVDVRGALVDPAQFAPGAAVPLDFPSAKISQYRTGSRPGSRVVEQLQFNPPNLPIFAKGTKPFVGDYIDVAALAFVPNAAGNWSYNTNPANAAVFHAVWTDNRDVRSPPVVCNPSTGICAQNWNLYTPAASTGGTSLYDSTQSKPVCVPGQAGTRNQNVYSSRITQGLVAGFRENTKPLLDSTGRQVQRGFALFVQNNRNQTVTYRLSYNTPLPAGTTASFSQNGPVSFLDATVPARSTIARNLFVTSSNSRASAGVTVTQISGPGGAAVPGGLATVAVTNPDITNPDITNPDITNPDITNPDITNPDITNPDITTAEIYNPTVTNPDITNPDITNPDITNPQITNPDITNPDITNPDITNPDITSVVVTNPDITNPDITNPDITNPDITNPDITNPDITSLPAGGATDFTWKLTNKGNTGVSYDVRMFQQKVPLCCPAGCTGAACPAGCFKCQLILRRTYPTPVANNCNLAVEATNLTVASIPNPAFVTPSNAGSYDNSSDATNATLAVAPGEAGRITLRVFGLGGLNPNSPPPANIVQPTAVAAGANTGLSQNATSLTITTIELPIGVAGQTYSAALQSVGGVGATRAWSVATGSAPLPSGFNLNAATGALGGAPSAAGSTDINFQVLDSPTAPVQPHVDRQLLTLQVNQLSVSGVTAAKTGSVAGSPGSAYLKAGDTATVTVTVSNIGPAAATGVTVLLTSPLSCTLLSPLGAVTILGSSTQVFSFKCGPATGAGTATFAAQVTGFYVNLAATTIVSLQPAVSSNPLVVDTTPPVITPVVTAGGVPFTPGPLTWTNQAVTVTFNCTDNQPGPLTVTSSVTLSAGGAGQAATGSCTDLAGNTVTATVTGIHIDLTGPVVTFGAPAPAPNAAGWNNTAVTVPYTVTDALSGVAGSASGSVILSTDGSGVTGTVTATDLAGNSTTVSTPAVNLDLTPPVITGSRTPAANAAGWNNSPVTVSFTCTDALSGVASSSAPTTLSTSGSGQSVTGTCTDAAGNQSTTTVSAINIDLTGPVVTFGAPAPAPNAAGWNNTPVAIPYTVTDALSGAGSAPGSVVLSTEGSGVTGTVTVTDAAGNSTTVATPAANIDLTSPLITGSRTPAANAAGWNNSPVTVSFTCSDALSGVASSSGPSTLSADGSGQSAAGTCTDRAGNSASASVGGINIDKTPPTVVITSPANGAKYAPGATVTAAYACADTGSGLASCVGTTANGAAFTVTQYGTGTFSVVATDAAGNVTTVTSTYTVSYQFAGFLTPLSAVGPVSAPTNSGSSNLGKAVPLKWQLKDGTGAFIANDLTTLTKLQAVLNPACGGAVPASGVSTLLYSPTAGATGGSTFRYDSTNNQYIFNWDTSSVTAAACYDVVIALKDTNSYATLIKLQ